MPQSNLILANNVNSLIGGGGKKPKPNTATPQQLADFGNWTGQTDTKVMAKDLSKRGLIGADQLLADNPNMNDKDSIRNSQSDWKPAAIALIVANARKYNLRKPEELSANRELLLNSLDPRIKDAIKNPYFTQIHPNFWNVLDKSIIPQQWAKVDAANQQNTALNK